MNNNKRHTILHISLSVLLFFALGINTCYAGDLAEIVNVFRADHMRLDSSVYKQIDESVFRFIVYAPGKCGIPIFTLFDENEDNPHENLYVERRSEPDIDQIKWIVTNIIKNDGGVVHPKFYTLTFDENFSDPKCATKHENITNLEINPYFFPKGDEIKKLTIKNIYPHAIELTYVNVNDDQVIQKYVTIPNSSEPINIPAGEAYTLELHPGVCPAGSAKEPRALLKFSYKVKVNDNFYEKILSISVGIFCHRELERAIEAGAATLKDLDAALSTLEALKLKMAAMKKAAELEKAAAIKAEGDKVQAGCEAACINELIRQRDETWEKAMTRYNAKPKPKERQDKEEL